MCSLVFSFGRDAILLPYGEHKVFLEGCAPLHFRSKGILHYCTLVSTRIFLKGCALSYCTRSVFLREVRLRGVPRVG